MYDYGYNGWANAPYQAQPSQSRAYMQIVTVNGENGARAFSLSPNCSALLLDERDPIVWFVRTDGAGFKTVTPYSISPIQPEPQVSLSDIINRLDKLEATLKNGKSDTTADNAITSADK